MSCSKALTKARSALGEYTSLDTSHSIEYLCDDDDLSTCEIECEQEMCTCADVAKGIGDVSSIRTEAFAEATTFRDNSISTVSRLAAYSNARAAYDSEYLANKTASMRKTIADAIDAVVAPFVACVSDDLMSVGRARVRCARRLSNASFSGLYAGVGVLVGCVSTRDAENYTDCPLVQDARALYDHVLETVRRRAGVTSDSTYLG